MNTIHMLREVAMYMDIGNYDRARDLVDLIIQEVSCQEHGTSTFKESETQSSVDGTTSETLSEDTELMRVTWSPYPLGPVLL